MKHAVLSSVAHNFVDSYGNGNGFLIGYFQMDVYGEAARSSEGFIEIDFLTGKFSGAAISDDLVRATELYREELPDFCKKHGASLTDFKTFIAKFWNEYNGKHCKISVQDSSGKLSEAEYIGDPPKRIKATDDLGRIRTKPNRVYRL